MTAGTADRTEGDVSAGPLRATGESTAAEAAERMLYACLRCGLSLEVSSGTVLTLAPPLTIREDELERALSILEAAFAEVEAESKA